MKRFLLVVLLSVPFFVSAQDGEVLLDSAWTEEVVPEVEPMSGKTDSSAVETRSVDQSRLNELKNDRELNYKEPPTIGENIFQRIWRWILELLYSIINAATTTNWGRVFLYLFGIAVLVVIVMLILKVDAFKIFYSRQGATVRMQGIEENIHEIDFEKEISNSIKRNDYRRAVRLVFLSSLKMLSDKQYIEWQQGKTNHEYVSELKEARLQEGFGKLSYYFDYAWYGNFPVTRDLYEQVNQIFSDWRQRV